MAAALLADAPARGARPLSVYFSPVSPLQLGGEVSEALLIAARAGAICEILPAPTAGTTAPAALWRPRWPSSTREVLAGVVAVQATCPDTPCTYGARLHAGDPRTGAAVWGTPVLGLCAAGATLLARRCGLACDCYGLATDAGVVDAQNGYERALNGLLGALARPRYLSGIGGLASVVAAGFEQIEIDDEILGYILFALEERPWDAEALDAGALAEGVRAGSFLGVRQTRAYVRSEACPSAISLRGAAGAGSVLEAAEARVREHLAADPVGLPEGVETRLCELIDAGRRRSRCGPLAGPPSPARDGARRDRRFALTSGGTARAKPCLRVDDDEVPGRVVQALGAFRKADDDVLQASTEPPRHVDPGLDAERRLPPPGRLRCRRR